jgi:hypothetical protein
VVALLRGVYRVALCGGIKVEDLIKLMWVGVDSLSPLSTTDSLLTLHSEMSVSNAGVCSLSRLTVYPRSSLAQLGKEKWREKKEMAPKKELDN